MPLERFWVGCPGCGDRKGRYSTARAYAGRSYNCGAGFRVNIEEQCAEVIDDEDNRHRNGRG